jgi:hypothetical protein
VPGKEKEKHSLDLREMAREKERARLLQNRSVQLRFVGIEYVGSQY